MEVVEDEIEEDQAGNVADDGCRGARQAAGAGELDDAINPVTMEDLVRVRDELRLPPEEALVLQLAVQGLELPNAPASAREFCVTLLH